MTMQKQRPYRGGQSISSYYLYSAVVGMGICILLLSLAPKEERAREFGILFLLVAAVGGFLALRRWQQIRQVLREAELKQAAFVRRSALRKERKARDLDERSIREEKRAAKARAIAENRVRRLRESELKRQAEETETLRRTAQEAHITAEVGRMRSLKEVEYFADVMARLTKRGFLSARPVQETDTSRIGARGLFLECETAEGGIEAMRILPPSLAATAEDVHALEAWRRDIGASRAWLVSLAGFTPEAALAVGRLSLLLIDAEILAGWSL